MNSCWGIPAREPSGVGVDARMEHAIQALLAEEEFRDEDELE